MLPILSFSCQRVLVFAPHPDDESLATGGLLQRAKQEGAEVRVVFVSDGDNNPWPQRLLEHRWKIGPRERARWGARRRAEALAALRCLGIGAEDVQFLGLPDQGTTRSLLQADQLPLQMLAETVRHWQPTMLVAPSPHDIHPDHNALAMLVDLVLAGLGPEHSPKLIQYVVHRRKTALPAAPWCLTLSAQEQATKRQAILQHGSQMALSRKRFVAYARNFEHFYAPGVIDPSHPIRSAGLEGGALCVRIEPGRMRIGGELFIAGESLLHGSVRWRIALGVGFGVVRVRDAATGRVLRRATLRVVGRAVEVRVPLSPAQPLRRIAVKFDRRLAFYDEAGWAEVALPAANPILCSGIPSPATRSSSLSYASSSFGGGSEVSG